MSPVDGEASIRWGCSTHCSDTLLCAVAQYPLLTFPPGRSYHSPINITYSKFSPVHNFNVTSNFHIVSSPPLEFARLVTWVPQAGRWFAFVFCSFAFLFWASCLSCWGKEGEWGREGVNLNKCLLVPGGKESLLSHWLDLFPVAAGGLGECVVRLIVWHRELYVIGRRCLSLCQPPLSLRSPQRGVVMSPFVL